MKQSETAKCNCKGNAMLKGLYIYNRTVMDKMCDGRSEWLSEHDTTLTR